MSQQAALEGSPGKLIEQFFEQVFNRQDADTARMVIAPDFVAHHPSFPEGIRGPDGILQMSGMFRGGFPDLRYVLDDQVSGGDRTAVRWHAKGTHQGVFLGVPPTGRTINISGIDIFRIADGALVEAWVMSDFFGLFQQLGSFPPPLPGKQERG